MRIINVSTRDLLFALADRAPGTSHYLDVETGEVVPVFSFNRERILAMLRADANRYIRVAPQSGAQGFEMMRRFSATVSRQALREKLEAALKGEGAFGSFRAVLKNVPTEYRRWRLFRIETMTESLRARLRGKGIEMKLVADDEPQ